MFYLGGEFYVHYKTDGSPPVIMSGPRPPGVEPVHRYGDVAEPPRMHIQSLSTLESYNSSNCGKETGEEASDNGCGKTKNMCRDNRSSMK